VPYKARDREVIFMLEDDLALHSACRKYADAKEEANGRSISEISPVL
jgi:hypothetical protein